jgi:hypothetical protein
MAVPDTYFKNIKICETPTETGCYCAWRTFERGFTPDAFYPTGNQFKVTNPLSWRTDSAYVSRQASKGSVLFLALLKLIWGGHCLEQSVQHWLVGNL